MQDGKLQLRQRGQRLQEVGRVRFEDDGRRVRYSRLFVPESRVFDRRTIRFDNQVGLVVQGCQAADLLMETVPLRPVSEVCQKE